MSKTYHQLRLKRRPLFWWFWTNPADAAGTPLLGSVLVMAALVGALMAHPESFLKPGGKWECVGACLLTLGIMLTTGAASCFAESREPGAPYCEEDAPALRRWSAVFLMLAVACFIVSTYILHSARM